MKIKPNKIRRDAFQKWLLKEQRVFRKAGVNVIANAYKVCGDRYVSLKKAGKI